MVYVFSTLTGSVKYVLYAAGGADLPVADQEVVIAGGTNVPDKHLITPRGVMTSVSDEAYSWLQDDEVFKMHVANGFISVSDKRADPEKVAGDMNTRDASAPLVDADFEPDKVPVTSAAAPSTNQPTNRRRG